MGPPYRTLRGSLLPEFRLLTGLLIPELRFLTGALSWRSHFVVAPWTDALFRAESTSLGFAADAARTLSPRGHPSAAGHGARAGGIEARAVMPRRADVPTWYQGLRDLTPDPARGAIVSDLTLTRDVGEFHLIDGQIHALNTIDGRTVGVVFAGTGRFTFSAPDPLEQAQLVRRYEASSLDTEIRAAVFLFTDFTFSDLEQSVSFGPLEPTRDQEREASEAREYFTGGDGWVSRKVLLPLINQGPGFFYAHVSEDRGDPMIFSVDPFQFEEVSLTRKRDRIVGRATVSLERRMVTYS